MKNSFESNLIKIPAKDVVDELYGKPPTKGEKDIAEFRKKKIKTPEKINQNIIKAENQDGQELVFDMEKIHQESVAMFKEFNLQELAEKIENIEINLTSEQRELVEDKIKKGFNKFYVFPPVELQKEELAKIADEAIKPMVGLDESEQYQEYGWGDSIEDNNYFPDEIELMNRPKNKPYLIFLKDTIEGEKIKFENIKELEDFLKKERESGLTLAEYLIVQRDFVKRNKEHLDYHRSGKGISLLDSRLSDNTRFPDRFLQTNWDRNVLWVSTDDIENELKYNSNRFSAILEV